MNGRRFNPFAYLPPSQRILAQARREGVDTTSKPAVEDWLNIKRRPST